MDKQTPPTTSLTQFNFTELFRALEQTTSHLLNMRDELSNLNESIELNILSECTLPVLQILTGDNYKKIGAEYRNLMRALRNVIKQKQVDLFSFQSRMQELLEILKRKSEVP